MMVAGARTPSTDSPRRNIPSSVSASLTSDTIPSITPLIVDNGEEGRTSTTEDNNYDDNSGGVDHVGLEIVENLQPHQEEQSQPSSNGIRPENDGRQHKDESQPLNVRVRLPLSDQIVLLQKVVHLWYGRDLDQTTLTDVSSFRSEENNKNSRNKNRCTPLMEAAKYGREDSVYVMLILQYYMLLKSSQQQHEKQQRQIQTILHQICISLQLAIWEGHEHIVRLLLLVGSSSRWRRIEMDGSQACDMLERFYYDTLHIHSTCDILRFDMLAIAIVQCHYPILHLLLGKLYCHSKSKERQRGGGEKETAASILQQTDEFGRTILHLALMSCGDITIIQKILKCCPKLLHLVDKDSRTPLQYAIANQDKVKVRYLLDLGAKVNTSTATTVGSVDKDGISISSPLHMAACYPIPSIVKSLLQCGADFTQRDMYGRTPFIVACSYGHVVVVQMFISKCCKKNSGNNQTGNKRMQNRDNMDYTSTIISPTDSSNHDVQLDINEPDYHGQTPLHYAVMGSHIGVAQLLLQHGADVNVQTYPFNEDEQDGDVDSCLWTPLHIASYWGCNEIVQLLFDHEAVLTIKNHAGETPVDVAKRNNQLQTVNLILQLQEKQQPKLHKQELRKQQQSRGRQPEKEKHEKQEEEEDTRSDHRRNHDEMMDVLSSLL